MQGMVIVISILLAVLVGATPVLAQQGQDGRGATVTRDDHGRVVRVNPPANARADERAGANAQTETGKASVANPVVAGELSQFLTTAVYGADIFLTYTASPPVRLDVCGFSAIPGAIGEGYDAGIAQLLHLAGISPAVFINALIDADCVTIFPQPGYATFPLGQWRLDILPAPDYMMVDFVYFAL